MLFREYPSHDSREIARLFHDTVHAINSRDYTQEQVAVWTPDAIDEEHWQRRLDMKKPLVAEIDGKIVGFAELEPDGHLDCFYVHKDYQRMQIGQGMLEEIEKIAAASGVVQLYAEVSMTAVPFFAKNTFRIIRDNITVKAGVSLKNYLMEKYLSKPVK